MISRPTSDPQIFHGDCLELLKLLPDESVDASVTDPPYGMSQIEQKHVIAALTAWMKGEPYLTKKKGFMGRSWDGFVPGPEIWRELYRVLKPGGYALVFASSRTQDLMGISLRLAGFEIRDEIMWIQGQGFPKSIDVSKGIDEKLGHVRPVVGKKRGVTGENLNDLVRGAEEVRDGTDPGGKGVGAYGVGAKQRSVELDVTAPVSEEAKRYAGYGTALKPSYEPIICARKPLHLVPGVEIIPEISGLLEELLCQLMWCAKSAGSPLSLSHHVPKRVCDFAPCLAATLHGEECDGWPEEMVIFNSPAVAEMSWNIARSWRAILVAASLPKSTCTTETEIDQITVLKILRCSISAIMRSCMVPRELIQNGQLLGARTVEKKLPGESPQSPETPRPTVTEPATEQREPNSVYFAEQNITHVALIVDTVLRDAIMLLGAETESPPKPPSRPLLIEPIIVARKPLRGTVPENVLAYGTGALDIDGCRVPHAGVADLEKHTDHVARLKEKGGTMENNWKCVSDLSGANDVTDLGRFPPNVVLTHAETCRVVGHVRVKGDPRGAGTGTRPGGFAEPGAYKGEPAPNAMVYGDELQPIYECAEGCPVGEMDRQAGVKRSGLMKAGTPRPIGPGVCYGLAEGAAVSSDTRADAGSVTRFFPIFDRDELNSVAGDDSIASISTQSFPVEGDPGLRYVPKTSRGEREAGCTHLPKKKAGEATGGRKEGSAGLDNPRAGASRGEGAHNYHPTVKPEELMRWLVRLVTFPGAVVLDLFMGSGSTGVAAVKESRGFIGFEQDAGYVDIACARIDHAVKIMAVTGEFRMPDLGG